MLDATHPAALPSSKGSTMKIGIIGAGNTGDALTRLFRIAGHEVTVANSRGPALLTDLAAETGARGRGTVEDAVRGQVVLVVTIPLNRVPELPGDLFAGAPADLIVIDTSNYYPQQRDGLLAGIEDGATESGWIHQHLGRPVIKAFNSIISAHLAGRGQAGGCAGADRARRLGR